MERDGNRELDECHMWRVRCEEDSKVSSAASLNPDEGLLGKGADVMVVSERKNVQGGELGKSSF
jgi:hypothetical protein